MSKLKFGELKPEEYRGDNVIHFQDPRSVKFNGQLGRPLTRTKNERNYTSYNFIHSELNALPKKLDEPRYVRKTSAERYREPAQMRALIMGFRVPQEERESSRSKERSMLARCTGSQSVRNLLLAKRSPRDGSTDFEEDDTREFSRGRRNMLGEYIFSSGIACLPTGMNAPNMCQYYSHRPKDERSHSKELSASTRLVYRKNYQGDSIK
jgi:hypothetical protein